MCVDNWFCALCEGSSIHYLSGFVGVCLLQYFHRRHADTAFAVLLRLLNRKVVFTQTVCRLLKVSEVVGIAAKVRDDSVVTFFCICVVALQCCLFDCSRVQQSPTRGHIQPLTGYSVACDVQEKNDR